MSKLPQEAIEQARDDIVATVEKYGIKLEKRGKEFFGLCPFHNESSPSFTVTPAKGRYHCFGCGANGDPIQFVQDYAGVSFREAVQAITGGEVDPAFIPVAKRDIEREEEETWVPMATVPDSAPTPMNIINKKINDKWHKLVSTHSWAYLDADGKTIGYIFRFPLPPKPDGSQGGKEVVPQTYCVNQQTGEVAWRWLSFVKPRPLYGLDKLTKYPKAQVILVEGEKSCDAAQKEFIAANVSMEKLITVSWPGGGKAVKHTEWAPLYGRSVGLWPDADQKTYPDQHPAAGMLMPFHEQPGTVAMMDIFARIREHCTDVKFFMPPVGVPDGWDLADEMPANFKLLTHIKANTRKAIEMVSTADDEMEDSPPWTEMEPVLQAVPQSIAPPAKKPESAAPAKKPDLKVVKSVPAASQKPSIEKKASAHDALEAPVLRNNGYFRVLGYDHERYFILSFEKCQIMVLTKADFGESGLIDLAPLEWWETNFPGGKSASIDKKAAMNWIVRKAHSRGVYDMERIRGRGAWTDKGRNIFHHGDYLSVDGVSCEISALDSHYVYEMSKALPDISDVELTDEEGMKLLDLAGEFSWDKPASAALMAGWCALAPIGGALAWRSHIWLTGGAGSGKTTILGKYINFLTNGIRLFAQGNSSEAGIRQKLKSDALPVLFDESESNSERDGLRIQSVLSMVRQSSSESQAEVFKGSAGGDAMAFHIRSMFCLASIQVGIKFQADIERMTVLSLKSARDDPDSTENWHRIRNMLYSLNRDEDLPGRLVRRSLNLLPVTLQNIVIFADVAAERFGSQRDGDQYGTLLAGAWSMISKDVATPEQAAIMIDGYDWTEHRENNDVDEGERALSALMGAHIRHNGIEVTVHELIKSAKGYDTEGLSISSSTAEAILQRNGMRTDGDRLIISNQSMELRKLMQGTPFEADLRGVLRRVRGADRAGNRTYKFSGIGSKVISIPLQPLLAEEIQLPPNEPVSF